MAIPKERKITADEFLSFSPETNERCELFDGHIFMQAAPSVQHQHIVGQLYFEIQSFIRKNKGKCQAFVAPVDVKLDFENVVQPDVLVVCDPSKLDEKRCNGAPDFVIEVVSSDRSADFSRKLELYRRFGVKEYWIVDPQEQRVVVYIFGNTLTLNIYTFEQQIPVDIYNGELCVKIAELM